VLSAKHKHPQLWHAITLQRSESSFQFLRLGRIIAICRLKALYLTMRRVVPEKHILSQLQNIYLSVFQTYNPSENTNERFRRIRVQCTPTYPICRRN
jgi:hypothetical protein